MASDWNVVLKPLSIYQRKKSFLYLFLIPKRSPLNKILCSIFKASSVIEVSFFSKKDIWSVIISFFLGVLGIFSIWLKFSYISLVNRKYPFIMELMLMKNINKTPKKIENVNDDGNKWVRQSKIRFQKMTFHPTDLCFCKNKVTNCLFRCLF